MSGSFQSINEAPEGGTPQFQQEQAVSDGKANTLNQVATVGSTLFQSAANASAATQANKSQSAQAAALGGLQQKLLDVRQAGATGGIDVVREQRKLMSKFNVDFPHLRVEGNKAFKAETGVAPAQASPDEVAERKQANEAISNGFGRHGAGDAYNEEQLELYIQTKRADKVNASRLTEINLMKSRGEMSKELVRDTVLGSYREMSTLAYKKAVSDSQSIVTSVGDGTMSVEEANLAIRKQRIDITRAVSSLGEHSQDPSVQAYTAPILQELLLAEDIVNGKIEMDAAKSIIARNKSKAQAIFFGDPDRVNLAVLSETFGHTVGMDAKMTKFAYKFLTDGLTEDGMVPDQPRPVDPTKLDEDGKAGVTGTVTNVLNSSDEKAKKEVSATLAGVAEHLNRNGMDYDSDDKQFVIDLLSSPKAMATLTPQQKESVMIGFEMYIVDETKVKAEKYITNPPVVNVPIQFSGILGGSQATEPKKMVEVADITVTDGRIYWTVKPEFATSGRVQNVVRTTNRKIAKEVTPTISILSQGSGIGFEEVGKNLGFVREEEEEEQEVKKSMEFENDEFEVVQPPVTHEFENDGRETDMSPLAIDLPEEENLLENEALAALDADGVNADIAALDAQPDQSVAVIKDAMKGRESNSPSDIFGGAVQYFPENYDVTKNTIQDVLAKGEAATKAINTANDALFAGEGFTDEDRAYKKKHTARKVFEKYGDRGYVIPSSAAGTYQMITPTLLNAVNKTDGVELTDNFDEATQDKLALGIAMARPAIKAFVEGDGDIEKALKQLGMEWEAFTHTKNRAAGIKMLKGLKKAAKAKGK
jgi:muramidase (phage lysozyme)